jgi:hypothetical protein
MCILNPQSQLLTRIEQRNSKDFSILLFDMPSTETTTVTSLANRGKLIRPKNDDASPLYPEYMRESAMHITCQPILMPVKLFTIP